MKYLKSNQVIIIVVALMLVTAGYLNFTANNEKENNLIPTSGILDTQSYADIGDATLVNGKQLVNDENDIANANNTNQTASSITDNTITSSSKLEGYFSESKLQREKMYSQMIESYQKMLESTSVSEEQKAIAQNEITKINNTKNSIMVAENLIETKGFKNVVIFVNDQSISVILEEDSLTTDKIAQVQNIVSREMKAEIENIHISNK